MISRLLTEVHLLVHVSSWRMKVGRPEGMATTSSGFVRTPG